MGPIDFLWEWEGVGGHTCIHCMLHCILGTLMYTGQPVLVPNLLLDTVHMRLVWIPGMDQVSTSLHFTCEVQGLRNYFKTRRTIVKLHPRLPRLFPRQNRFTQNNELLPNFFFLYCLGSCYVM